MRGLLLRLSQPRQNDIIYRCFVLLYLREETNPEKLGL
eukprot:XP_001707023.1 Hypothetical protein GL50803_36281 [Giardia lamblia ATCC 50803]